MRIIDPGHFYLLDVLDGYASDDWGRGLLFVKRVGDKYPGNAPPAHYGTTSQEVLRALIDRSEYVNRQIPCAETEAAIGLLNAALLLFEVRAKRVNGSNLDVGTLAEVVTGVTCPSCGHVKCERHG